jgi:hypothetical protein
MRAFSEGLTLAVAAVVLTAYFLKAVVPYLIP